jgi:hypothetical protein
MEIGMLKMHEQVLTRACFCDVVCEVNNDNTLVNFYKVGKSQPFLIAIYVSTLQKWTMQYDGNIFFQDYAFLSDLIRVVCLSEFNKNMELKYPYFYNNNQPY